MNTGQNKACEEMQNAFKKRFGFEKLVDKKENTWICQMYNNYYRQCENGPRTLSKNAEVRQRPVTNKISSPNDLKETLLDPEMIGLR